MTVLNDKPIFDAVRLIKAEGAKTRDGRLTDANVAAMKAAIAALSAVRDPVLPVSTQPAVAGRGITERIALEIAGHEAIILEMYKDSVGVETWSAGLTRASGIDVRQYKDNPSTMQEAINAYIRVLTGKYLADVNAEFAGHTLTEAQLAAALSFHWNTGAIKNCAWADSWKAGFKTRAKAEFMNYSRPREIIGRREAERDLFFDGKWTSDGKVGVYDVNRRTYSPIWRSLRRVDVRPEIRAALSK